MSAFAADVRPRSLSTGARPIKIEAICKKNRIRANAVLLFCSTFCVKKLGKPRIGGEMHAERAVPAGTLPQGGKNRRRRQPKKAAWPPRGAAEAAKKGFNFVSGKVLFGCADSRFAKPRSSPERERVVTFCIVQKVTKKHAGLRPATSIQIAGRTVIVAKVTGIYQVTGFAKSCNFAGYRRQ